MGANLRQICSRGRNATHRLYPSWAPSAARPQLPGVLATLFSSAPAGMKEGIVLVVEKKGFPNEHAAFCMDLGFVVVLS